jgi:hypothetical protein
MKNMVKKILFLMLIVSFVAFGFGCCKGKGKTCGHHAGEHPTTEHPAKDADTHEHPDSEHPAGDSE